MGEVVQFPPAAVLDGIPGARQQLADIAAERASRPPVPEHPIRQMTERWPEHRWTGEQVDGLELVMRIHPPEYVLTVVDDVCSEPGDHPPSANALHARIANFGYPRGRLMSNGVRWRAVGDPADPPGTLRWIEVQR